VAHVRTFVALRDAAQAVAMAEGLVAAVMRAAPATLSFSLRALLRDVSQSIELDDHLETLLALHVRCGGSVHDADAAGCTPLHLAAAAASPRIVAALLALGACGKARAANGDTPLRCAERRLRARHNAPGFMLRTLTAADLATEYAVIALLLPHTRAVHAQLVGGVLTPRMHFRLLSEACFAIDYVRDGTVDYFHHHASPGSDPTLEWYTEYITCMEYVPAAIRAAVGASRAFADGLGACARGVADALEARQFPSQAAVAAAVAARCDAGAHEAQAAAAVYFAAGGRATVVLAYLLDTVQENLTANWGDTDWCDEQAHDALPYLEALEGDYDWLRHALLSDGA
jgi:hypothetical protein